MEGSVRVKTFSQEFEGQEVYFYVLCLKQSFLLWAGPDLSFTSLSVAMNTRFVSILLSERFNLNAPHLYMYLLMHTCIQESDPTSTQLLGDATNSSSSSFAKRLGAFAS